MPTKQMEAITKFKELVESTGLKKEHLIKESGINRNKFYFSLKAPSILTPEEVKRLSKIMRIDEDIVQTIINSDIYHANP